MAVEEAQLESPLHEHAHTPHDKLVVIAWSGELDKVRSRAPASCSRWRSISA